VELVELLCNRKVRRAIHGLRASPLCGPGQPGELGQLEWAWQGWRRVWRSAFDPALPFHRDGYSTLAII
jgi:hypothetical protein